MKFFKSLTILQQSLIVSILSIILFISSAGATYSIFSKSSTSSVAEQPAAANTPTLIAQDTEDPKEPKTESCPLNGQMRTKTSQEKWSQKIPLAVMIENHQEARPQSGLSSADVVYEAVAEGGITRFMAVFLCNPNDLQVGPVRSARTYYLDWLSEYNALYAHVGGANTPGPADALSQIIRYGIKDLNQFSIGFPTFWRDYQRLGHAVATEHTMYSTTAKLWDVGTKRNYLNASNIKTWTSTFIPWKFKDDFADAAKTKVTPALADKVGVEFWQGFTDYAVNWEFDKTCDCYKRSNGGVAHTDLNFNRQIMVKNIVVQFERESRANDGYENNVHLIYKTTGEGKALFFLDGKVVEGKWIKPTRLARSKYVNSQGSEISFNRGLIWIQTVPEGAKVSY